MHRNEHYNRWGCNTFSSLIQKNIDKINFTKKEAIQSLPGMCKRLCFISARTVTFPQDRKVESILFISALKKTFGCHDRTMFATKKYHTQRNTCMVIQMHRGRQHRPRHPVREIRHLSRPIEGSCFVSKPDFKFADIKQAATDRNFLSSRRLGEEIRRAM